MIRISSLCRHKTFGDIYRPFCERLSRVFDGVCRSTPEQWGDRLHQSPRPDVLMAFWAHLARVYEIFTRGEKKRGRKEEIFSLMMAAAGGNLKKAKCRYLTQREAKKVIKCVSQA
jgi:hypothetical protein